MTTSNKIVLGMTALGLAGIAFYFLSKRSRQAVAAAAGGFIFPIRSVITEVFGYRINPVTDAPDFHNGIDLRAATGTAIVAPMAGVVESEYANAAGGNQMIIAHPNGFKSGYAHLDRYAVGVGDPVAQGQVIAYSGNTGQTTAAHLHFTLKDPSGNFVDPANYLV